MFTEIALAPDIQLLSYAQSCRELSSPYFRHFDLGNRFNKSRQGTSILRGRTCANLPFGVISHSVYFPLIG